MSLFSKRLRLSLRLPFVLVVLTLLASALNFSVLSEAQASSNTQTKELSVLLKSELDLKVSEDKLNSLSSGTQELMTNFLTFIHKGNELFVGKSRSEEAIGLLTKILEHEAEKNASDITIDSLYGFIEGMAESATKHVRGAVDTIKKLVLIWETGKAMHGVVTERIVADYINNYRNVGMNDADAWKALADRYKTDAEFKRCNPSATELIMLGDDECSRYAVFQKGGDNLHTYAQQTYEAFSLAQRLKNDPQSKEILKQWVLSEVEKAQNANIEQPSLLSRIATAITTTVVKAADAVQTFIINGVQAVNSSLKTTYTSIKEFFTGATSQKDEAVIQPSDLSGRISNALSGDANKSNTVPVQPSNTLKPQETQSSIQTKESSAKQSPQPSSTTTQVKTINLRYKTGCDKNWGSPIPFVSLDWDVSYENMTSQTIYRNNEVILNAPPSVGPSYFDGTIKAGRTYNYVIKAEYKDGYSNSTEANVVVPIDVCGPINPVQNETPASQPPSISPAPSVVPPASSSGGGGSGSIPQTNTPPTKKTIIATIVDQNGASFDYLIFACEKPDGSNCSIQTYSSGMMALGPYPSGEYRITVQAGARGGEKSDAVVRSVRVDETASGTSVDLGTIVLKRWGRIFVSPIDEVGNPRLVYWELEGVFDNDLCGISPLSLIGGLNRDYYCSNGKTFYNYSLSNRTPSLYLEKYSLPDGQYTLKAFDSPYSSTESLYKTTIRISQGQDVDLGIVEIKP